jgi:serine/threonine protein kinase
VLVADDGHVTLAGFGLATAPSIPRRRSEATGRLRSIDFRALSPEAAFGRPMSPAADLYGLGMLLATIVRGRHPVVEADSDLQIIEAIRAGRLELPEGTPLADLIRRTVVIDPQTRPSIAEFRAALGPADRAALVQLVR